MTVRALALALAVALALVPACRGGAPVEPRIAATDAIVRVKTATTDAVVWIDGRMIGSVDRLRGGIALDPGAHRLELRHGQHFVHYQELDLAPSQRLTLEIELAPLLP